MTDIGRLRPGHGDLMRQAQPVQSAGTSLGVSGSPANSCVLSGAASRLMAVESVFPTEDANN